MLDRLASLIAAHHAAIMITLGVLVSIGAAFGPRLAVIVRERAPRVYAIGAAIVALSPEFLRAGRYFLAVFSPRLLDELEKIPLAERATPTDPMRLPQDPGAN